MGIFDPIKKKFTFGQDQSIPEAQVPLIPQIGEEDPSQNPVRAALSPPEAEASPLATPEQRADLTTQLQQILSKGWTPEEPPPELAPKTGVKEALKRGLISRIPFVGPEMDYARKVNQLSAMEQWKQKNEAIQDKWKRQEALLAPLMAEQIKNDQFTTGVQNKYIHYMKNFVATGVWTKEQTAYAASGVPMPKHLQNASGQSKRIHIVGTPDGAVLPAIFMPRGDDKNKEPYFTYRNPVDGKPAMAFIKDIDKIMPEEPAREPQPKTPHYYTGEDKLLHAVDPITQEDTIVKGARPHIPPDNSGNFQKRRSDTSYYKNRDAIDKFKIPLDETVGRLSRLEDALKARTPAADALIAPEILTVMAGGRNSGLRMTEAEILRIVKGRSNFESMKAALNKWQSDPSKALSITDAQRQQMRDLVNEIGSKIRMKQGLMQSAHDQLLLTDDPMDHRRSYADLSRAISEIDSGKVRYIQGNNGAWVKFTLEGEKWVKAKAKIQ